MSMSGKRFSFLPVIAVLCMASPSNAQKPAPGQDVIKALDATEVELNKLAMFPREFLSEPAPAMAKCYVVRAAIKGDPANLKSYVDQTYGLNLYDPTKRSLSHRVCKIPSIACEDEVCFIMSKGMAEAISEEYGDDPGITKLIFFLEPKEYEIGTERSSHKIPFYGATIMAVQRWNGKWIVDTGSKGIVEH
jgi:hypothetical protein